ncbi:Hypothetical predicted protein [Octopus vulgaris]|uniref:Uncharacterized protein n=1 Tax=Octopus vulgaris TaxID=6645 RepID=A0AA36BD07_OCTVU|nr:Hypothetical predicted protein [Octopus vulgaris]
MPVARRLILASFGFDRESQPEAVSRIHMDLKVMADSWVLRKIAVLVHEGNIVMRHSRKRNTIPNGILHEDGRRDYGTMIFRICGKYQSLRKEWTTFLVIMCACHCICNIKSNSAADIHTIFRSNSDMEEPLLIYFHSPYAVEPCDSDVCDYDIRSPLKSVHTLMGDNDRISGVDDNVGGANNIGSNIDGVGTPPVVRLDVDIVVVVVVVVVVVGGGGVGGGGGGGCGGGRRRRGFGSGEC